MSYEPIPAEGTGADLFDQPTLFYLTNRTLIDEWYSLRANVAEALSEWFLTTVRDSLTPPAADRGLEVSLARGPSGYHHVVLHPPDTPIINTKPIIGAGFGWSPKSVDPAAGNVFACVRCSATKTGKAAAALFREAGGVAAGLALNPRAHQEENWPLYWYLQAPSDWWTDLDAYRGMLVHEVTRLADAVSEPLQTASHVPAAANADGDGDG